MDLTRDEGFVRVVRETLLSRRPARGSFSVALASVAALAGISIVYWLDVLGLASELPATGETVFAGGQYWRLLTTMGTHADPRHLLSNALAFAILSFLLFGYFGPRVYPAFALAMGALVTGLALWTYAPSVRLLGASGLVYWMAGFWLASYILIERRWSPGKRLVRALGFGLIVLVPTAWDPSVSYRTHAIGFGAGIVCGAGYFFKKKQDIQKLERAEWE